MLLAGVLARYRILQRECRMQCLEGGCRVAWAGGPHAQRCSQKASR